MMIGRLLSFHARTAPASLMKSLHPTKGDGHRGPTAPREKKRTPIPKGYDADIAPVLSSGRRAPAESELHSSQT